MYECPYEDTKINYTLADMLTEKYKELGVEQINRLMKFHVVLQMLEV